MRLQILFLTNIWRDGVNTIFDHASSFGRYSQNDIHYFDPFRISKPSWLSLSKFDVIIIHYPIYLFNNSFINESWREQIRTAGALKVLFVQDEYRQVNALHSIMNQLKIDVLYTCIPEAEIDNVYPDTSVPGLIKVNTLTGYVPEYLEGTKHFYSPRRDIDVGYRGRGVGFWWLGSLFREKLIIAETFRTVAPRYGLTTDISNREEDRISGQNWLEFLKRCRCTLGTESGASVIDFTGGIEQSVKEYTREHPAADFEEVKRHCFQDLDGAIDMNQISPRLFEAIGCGTALILFRGRYSGILEPGKHFIQLEKDFSNVDEVVEQLRDDRYIAQMTKTAYHDVIESREYSYRSFIESVDRDIQRLLEKKSFYYPEVRNVRREQGRLRFLFSPLIYLGKTIKMGFLVMGYVMVKAASFLIKGSGRYVTAFRKSRREIIVFPFRTAWLFGLSSAHLLRKYWFSHSLTNRGGLSLFLRAQFKGLERRTRRKIGIPGQEEFKKAGFWDEICGSSLWLWLGLAAIDKESLNTYDDFYLNTLYPYLRRYIVPSNLKEMDVLEIGVGFGTVGSLIASHAGTYIGLDSSRNPIRLLKQRLEWQGKNGSATALQSNARGLPFRSESFNHVVSIGCLHHTGDVETSLREVHRVLRPGGTAVIMLYHKHSFRNVVSLPFRYLLSLLSFTRKQRSYHEFRRAAFDSSLDGEVAPVTQFFSKKEVGDLFGSFAETSVTTENFDGFGFLGGIIPREKVLNSLGRIWGLDLYIRAVK